MDPTTSRFLIPVSERKKLGGGFGEDFAAAQQDRSANRFTTLSEERERVLRVFLSAINGQGHAEEVLRLKGENLDEAVALNLTLRDGPLLPVRERFLGPLFQQLEEAGQQRSDVRRRVRERVIAVCPLLGLLGLNDLIPAYRCPVGAQVPGFGSLHEFWKPRLGPVLNRACRNHFTYSFLPARMEALWQKRAPSVQLVQVHFKRRREGRLIHDHAGARREAGLLIRHMVENDLAAPEQVLDWESGSRHRFDAEHSELSGSERRLVFVR